MLLRRMVTLAVPVSVALIAFLHAHAIGSLVDSRLTAAGAASVAPFAEARAAENAPSSVRAKSAGPLFAHNPFDHTTTNLLPSPSAPSDDDPNVANAPPCEGVRASVAVRGEEADASLAALAVGGERLLRKRGGTFADWQVVYVAADRVWLEHDGKLCQARVFGDGRVTAAAPAPAVERSAREKDILKGIAKTGPKEFQIDRGAVERILEAQTELMRTPLVPEKEGDRVVGFRLLRVRPGSVIEALGLQTNDRLVSLNGIDITSTERMLEAYARLRTGTLDQLTIHVVRSGVPTNIDYRVR
jgi:general secretion pathway protein C